MSNLIEHMVKEIFVKFEKKVQDALDQIRKEIPTPDITHLEQRVEDAIKAIPDVRDGVDGKDGVSPTAEQVALAMEGLFAKWALDFERKADLVLQKAIEKIPLPKDGKNAFELEDFDFKVLEDNRTIMLSFTAGEKTIEKTVKLPVPIHVGVFKDTDLYDRGDCVTFGGSMWVATKDLPEGKPGSSEDWRLSVKKGRDGRESVKIEKKIETVKVD
jgi:hypothetical protein